MTRRLKIDSKVTELYSFMSIVSQLPDYRFIFNVNKIASMNFTHLKDLAVYMESEDKIRNFPLYYFDDEANRQEFYCIGCRSMGISILPTLKKYDYLIICNSEHQLFDMNKLAVEIKKIRDVILTNVIKPDSVKHLRGILIDLEMHMTELLRASKYKTPAKRT